MSDYVVHFTSSPTVFADILATGHLVASGPFGFSWARSVFEVQNRHLSVCFSEVPLDKIERLSRRHGQYGIGFTKEFVRRHQGARIWYVDQASDQARCLNLQLNELVSARNFVHPLWDLTPFMHLVMPGRYDWDWEREWRVRGDLHFVLSDVAFVVTPDGVDEFPGLDQIYVHPKHDFLVLGGTQPLAEYVEDLVQKFFETFEDPANFLPVDGGEYVWIVQEWETPEALEYLFPDLQGEVFDQVLDYLTGEGWSWVRSSDIADIYED